MSVQPLCAARACRAKWKWAGRPMPCSFTGSNIAFRIGNMMRARPATAAMRHEHSLMSLHCVGRIAKLASLATVGSALRVRLVRWQRVRAARAVPGAGLA
jgi:hypothetical protein